MAKNTEIRRRPDGSIDTDHYIARGRQLRSEAALGRSGPRQDDVRHRAPRQAGLSWL